MNVLICGSRGLPANIRNDVEKTLDVLKMRYGPKLSIMTGGATGPDSWAIDWATKNNVPKRTYRPVGRNRIYYLSRNAEMVALADRVIAFHNGSSAGTGFTIGYAKAREKELEVFRYGED